MAVRCVSADHVGPVTADQGDGLDRLACGGIERKTDRGQDNIAVQG